jgi:amino acid transporter
MLRLNQRQRTVIADTLRQVANVVFGAEVIGQFVTSQHYSLPLATAGLATWWVLFIAAVGFAGGNDHE